MKAGRPQLAKTSLLLEVIFKTNWKEPVFSAPKLNIFGKILDQLQQNIMEN